MVGPGESLDVALGDGELGFGVGDSVGVAPVGGVVVGGVVGGAVVGGSGVGSGVGLVD